jgi:hypothetical protein
VSLPDRERAVTLALEEAETLAEASAHLAHGQTAKASSAVQRALALALGRSPAVPVSLAARLLQISQPTIRKWVASGILQSVRERPLGIDPASFFEVLRAVRELRERGKDPTVRELLLGRIDDDLLLQQPALQQSLREMRRDAIRWVHG